MARLPCGVRALHDSLQPFQPLEPPRDLAGDVRDVDGAKSVLRHGRHRRDAYQGAPLGSRRKRGAFFQAIGLSRGGRTSKLHAATDEQGRPRLILLTPGNASDMATAPALIAALGPFQRLIADRGYDSNAIRALLAARGAEAVIPPSSPRVRQIPYDRTTYKARNLVERLWCRLKDWRRIATRYDKLARNYLSATLIAASLTYWCN